MVHWLLARFYDRLLRPLEESGLRGWRGELLASSTGIVLEVGAGTGLNLPHYPPDSRVVLTEPDRFMRGRLRHRLAKRSGNSFQIAGACLGNLPFPDGTFDVVISTLVLCSVPDLPAALSEIHRVLKEDGRFLFVEHVAAESNSRRLKWQRRVEPVWRIVGGNCHLTRRTAQGILQAGFRINAFEQSELSAAGLAQPLIRGEAVKYEAGLFEKGAGAGQ